MRAGWCYRFSHAAARLDGGSLSSTSTSSFAQRKRPLLVFHEDGEPRAIRRDEVARVARVLHLIALSHVLAVVP